jgi:hypothetical protein
MAESFRPLFEAMKEIAVALGEASVAIGEASAAIGEASAATARAGEGLKKMADAALHAQDEHEDLRETVLRLEGLVMQLSTDGRALRDERRNNGTS